MSAPIAASDAEVVQTGFGHNHGDPQYASPQAPMMAPPVAYYPVLPASPPREVMVEAQPAPRYVRRVAVPKTRRVVRQVEIVEDEDEEEPPARNILVRPRSAAPRSAAPRSARPAEEYEEVEEMVEVAPRSARMAQPRERVAVVEEAPVSNLRAVEVAEEPTLGLIKAGPLDRLAGVLGDRLRRRGLPRVDVQVETQKTYRVASGPSDARIVMTAPRSAGVAPPSQRQCVAPAVPYYLPGPVYPTASPQGNP